VTYDPRRLQGVSVYREAERDFAEGDRVQFTAPSKELHVASRELGTIVRLDERGEIAVHTDSGRLVEFQLRDHPHLDYGYAVTSHSSQGQTTDRVLIHADTEEKALPISEYFPSNGQYKVSWKGAAFQSPTITVTITPASH